MGISWSTRRRQSHYYPQHHPSYYPPPPYYHHQPPSSATVLDSPHPPPPQPQPNSNYVYVSNTPYLHYQQYPSQFQYNYSSPYTYPPNPVVGPPNFPFFPNNNAHYGNGGSHQMPAEVVPPPYVEHQSAKVVKNDVNVHKDTIQLVNDRNFPDHHLVSFVFDAHYDGSITIYYFAKEDKETFTFTPVYPEATRTVKVPFQKGIGQKFCQASGTGMDLGFFDLESLGKPSEDDVFPLIIFAEVYSSEQETGNEGREFSAEKSPRVQVTQAIVEKNNGGSFQVKAVRQILYIDGVRYELRDLYGIGNSSSEGFNDDEPGKECVICMTDPKNTAVMPCRHLCMCSDCAKELRLQTNKCPICRQPISELIEIKINNNSSSE